MKWWRFMFVGIGIILLLAGCSDQPRPEDAFQSYMESWENGEYEKMYEDLSENSKQLLNKEEFVDRYTTIYEGIDMANLSFTYELPEEEQEYETEDTPSFEFKGTLDSLGGAIEFSNMTTLVYEEEEENDDARWAVQWNSSMIFPQMEEGDEVRAWTLDPKRGEMFDVNGSPLAVNGGVLNVGIVPGWMEENTEEETEKLKKAVAEILDTTIEHIDQQLNQSWVAADTFVPVGAVAENDEETIKALKDDELPRGVKFQPDQEARSYPLGEAAAHLIGYVGPIQAEELEELESEGYTAADQLGKTGLESVLEEQLRGEEGGKVVIQTDEGETKEVLAETEAKDGKDFNLTISSEVQKSLHRQLSGESGAASAINPMTGDVLALVSAPAYDPNAIVLGRNEKSTLNKFNRTYSPGSTFKPITAAIGLEQGVITPEEELSIKGTTYEQNGYTVTRVAGAAEDEQVNLRDALVRSDNIYFARKILEIGGETFLQETREFGFGEDLPLTFPIESSQLLNGDAFERNALLGDTGFGQGEIQMSSLHLALTYTPFVTGGDLMKPRLVSSEEEGQVWHEKVMSEETASIVKNDLKAVVDDPAGTAYKPVEKGLNLAGKTGTAELKKSQEEDGQENGWFIAWDTENRDLMVSMMIEEAEGGSHYVVPKVKDVFSELQ
ncbi:penicillin-binding transpeptidase domain-containing protein [Halobacillus sp. HZG1]|uniref:penicillin-binding transpeptidase domain-containing protein n=1 Tax=Halobacillus sp. HZG1 TaxID=3111769 RepID=UPI002DB681EA|nr:penicillin-binding transpeptidase domain-containing protein [Halobacillus sp. HZG1]MEC3885232.1 penicillin-binding transpeptidase domain-containing protein [Halobacillus sp. HZG1]